ncbi:unnamed protein product, partial [Prorocentrum cordatum]
GGRGCRPRRSPRALGAAAAPGGGRGRPPGAARPAAGQQRAARPRARGEYPASEHSGSETGPCQSPRHSGARGPSEAAEAPVPEPSRMRQSMLSCASSSKTAGWAEDLRVLWQMRCSRSNLPSSMGLGAASEQTESASRIFRWLRGIVGNARYEVFWAAVVMVNTCTMILEEEWTGIRSGNRIGAYREYGSDEYMETWWPSANTAFFAIDCAFSLMFTVELVLTFSYDVWNRLLGLGAYFRHPFWTNPWDWLDLVIVVSSNLALLVGVGDGPMSNARFFRIFRLVRLLRLVRLVRKVNSLDPLHLMTTSIRGSATALVFSILLLLLIQTMFAMMLTQVLRYGWLSEGSSLSGDVQVQLFRYFGTYTRSMVTMFELMLANYPTVCRFLMEDVHEAFGCFVVFYKLSIGFAVIGVGAGGSRRRSRWPRTTSSSW